MLLDSIRCRGQEANISLLSGLCSTGCVCYGIFFVLLCFEAQVTASSQRHTVGLTKSPSTPIILSPLHLQFPPGDGLLWYQHGLPELLHQPRGSLLRQPKIQELLSGEEQTQLTQTCCVCHWQITLWHWLLWLLKMSHLAGA